MPYSSLDMGWIHSDSLAACSCLISVDNNFFQSYPNYVLLNWIILWILWNTHALLFYGRMRKISLSILLFLCFSHFRSLSRFFVSLALSFALPLLMDSSPFDFCWLWLLFACSQTSEHGQFCILNWKAWPNKSITYCNATYLESFLRSQSSAWKVANRKNYTKYVLCLKQICMSISELAAALLNQNHNKRIMVE